jgi:hypothetical protein
MQAYSQGGASFLTLLAIFKHCRRSESEEYNQISTPSHYFLVGATPTLLGLENDFNHLNFLVCLIAWVCVYVDLLFVFLLRKMVEVLSISFHGIFSVLRKI